MRLEPEAVAGAAITLPTAITIEAQAWGRGRTSHSNSDLGGHMASIAGWPPPTGVNVSRTGVADTASSFASTPVGAWTCESQGASPSMR